MINILLVTSPDIIPNSTVWTKYIDELGAGRRQEQDLKAVLNEAAEVEYMHEGRVGSLGKSSLYNRKLANSLFFNENYFVNLFLLLVPSKVR